LKKNLSPPLGFEGAHLGFEEAHLQVRRSTI
jgi:hypothetical protein